MFLLTTLYTPKPRHRFSCGELILWGDPNNVKKIPGKKGEHYPDTIGINIVVNGLRVWD